jgi:hypothetical protein
VWFQFPPKKTYSLQSKYKSKMIIPSQGGLAPNPIQPNPVGQKSHLLKAQGKVVMEIQKGKKVPITKALRARPTLKCSPKLSLYILMQEG